THRTIDQLDDAVVTQQQVVGHVTDRRDVAVTPYGEEELVLRAGEAHCLGLVLTPMLEPSQTVTEGEEPLEVLVVEHPGSPCHIETRYYRSTMIVPTPTKRLTLLAALAAILGVVGGGAAWVL